jgi:hypothetical protein
VQARVSEWSLSILPSPIPELQHTPLPLKCCELGNVPQLFHSSAAFHLDSHLSFVRSWGCVSGCIDDVWTINKYSPPLKAILFFFLASKNSRLVIPFVICCCCYSILWSSSPCLLGALLFKEATFFCYYYKDIDSETRVVPLVVGGATTCCFFLENLCILGHWVGHHSKI